MALVVKADPLPLLMATECRFLVSWAVSIAFMLAYKKQRGLHWFGPPELRWALLLKCALSFAFITVWWAALRRAPMGDCIAIIYCSPILTSIWSRAWLGEKLPGVFPVQTMLVSIGMLFVVYPPFVLRIMQGGALDTEQAGAPVDAEKADFTLVFVALVLCSLVPVATRRTRSCSWIEVEHVSACLAAAVLDPSLLVVKSAVSGSPLTLPVHVLREGILIIIAAMGSFVGIAMETKGYQMAEPGKAAMFRYVEVPFAYLLQVVGTGSPIAPRAVLGSTLILASCALGLTVRQAAAPEPAKEAAKEPLLKENAVGA